MVACRPPASGPERADRALPEVVCTDSRAALALLQSGPAAQRTPLAADIRNTLSPLAEGGQTSYMQRVPSHCGLPGNERADALAGNPAHSLKTISP